MYIILYYSVLTNISYRSIMTDSRCIQCINQTYQRLFGKFSIGISQIDEFNSFFRELTSLDITLTAPQIHRELNNKLIEITGNVDLFAVERQAGNQIAMDLYKFWKTRVQASADPFNLALRIAIAGNIMDYGAASSFDINQAITNVITAEFAIDHSSCLKKKISESETILYLGDNAGEIVFDRLFIETINAKNVVYAVKSAPVLNDVILKDAKETGMGLVARVISNGYDAPSTILPECSREFMELFDSADLIISKGQGNLEGLFYQKDPRLFFLLMAKCDPIADLLRVIKGGLVVANSRSIG
jgi:damage-control phosphatase, subfamily I